MLSSMSLKFRLFSFLSQNKSKPTSSHGPIFYIVITLLYCLCKRINSQIMMGVLSPWVVFRDTVCVECLLVNLLLTVRIKSWPM